MMANNACAVVIELRLPETFYFRSCRLVSNYRYMLEVIDERRIILSLFGALAYKAEDGR